MASNRIIRDRLAIVGRGLLRAAVIGTVAAFGLAAELAHPVHASAEFAAFLNIPEAPGESEDENHKDEIDVVAYRQVTTPPTAGGCRFFIQQRVDRSLPVLIEGASTGQVFPLATLTLRRSGGDRPRFLEIRLTNAKVERVGVEGDTQDLPSAPTATVRFAAESVEYIYTIINFDGSSGGNVTSQVNCVGGAALRRKR